MRAAEYAISVNDSELVTSRTLTASVLYNYDSEDNVTCKRVQPVGGAAQITYFESTDDNTVVKFTAGGKTVTAHSKTDSFGRKEFDELQLGSGFLSRQFRYLDGEFTDEHAANDKLKSSPTTPLVSEIRFADGRTISYEYDEEDRITKVDDSLEGVTVYTYDALGQLLTETKNNQLINEMAYVNAIGEGNYGNIVSKNGVTYRYDSVWKDLLTQVGDQTITYDAQGNPVNYLGHTLAWEKGRQLKAFDTNTYTYNANGIRTSKTVNGTKHEYLLDGTKILRESWGSIVLVPLYDNEDSVCGIEYNGTAYFFVKNLQGDVIAIANNSGDVVARYTYDAWGACTITQDNPHTIARLNPFRYRGYYYDTETELYYLQSRYYDPMVGRFINADEATIVVFIGENLLTNLYVYCDNNPYNNTDDYGTLSLSSIKRSIKSCISRLFSEFVKYISNLVTYKNRTITIQTVVVSATIDSLLFIIGSVASFIAKKAIFSVAKSIIFKNKKTTSDFMKWLIDLWNKIGVARILLWAISVKFGAKAVKIKGYLSDFSQNLIKGKSKIVDLYLKIKSLTSFSGIIAFLLDLFDGKADERIRIKV